MIDFEAWMFPPLAAGLLYIMHLIVMWRLKASDKRDRAAREVVAE